MKASNTRTSINIGNTNEHSRFFLNTCRRSSESVPVFHPITESNWIPDKEEEQIRIHSVVVASQVIGGGNT